MGAPLSKLDDVPFWIADTDVIEKLQTDGIEVNYDDLNILDPFLGYKDQLTVLYILSLKLGSKTSEIVISPKSKLDNAFR